jgi:hypothetical protein
MKRIKRVFSSGFKAELALEAIKGVKTVSELAQEYELLQLTHFYAGVLALPLLHGPLTDTCLSAEDLLSSRPAPSGVNSQ